MNQGQPQDQRQTAHEAEVQYRASRIADFSAVNMNTFWSTAMLVVAFAAWDAYADPRHWQSALQVRLLGAALIVVTGLFQRLPGQARWMPLLAKVRLVVAVVTTALAATVLDRGYGFAVAGSVAIILTGPYIAIGARDLAATNIAALLAVVLVMVVVRLDPFDMIGTGVFMLLAVAVSQLLGRVLEASNRRAFALDVELHREARTDALTGLDNRRAMVERGPLELKRAGRAGVPVSVILCDIDHFKSINDRHGHETGDAVLRALARTLRAALRDTDLLGRWGGEEFLAVLANTDARTAVEIAERMRVAVADTPLDAIRERATISIGVSTLHDLDPVAIAWDTLLKEADAHMYQAKSEGRNRVVGPPRTGLPPSP